MIADRYGPWSSMNLKNVATGKPRNDRLPLRAVERVNEPHAGTVRDVEPAQTVESTPSGVGHEQLHALGHLGLVGAERDRDLVGRVADHVEHHLDGLRVGEVLADPGNDVVRDRRRGPDDRVGEGQGGLRRLGEVALLVVVHGVEHRLVGARLDRRHRTPGLAQPAVVLTSPAQPNQLGGRRVEGGVPRDGAHELVDHAPEVADRDPAGSGPLRGPEQLVERRRSGVVRRR